MRYDTAGRTADITRQDVEAAIQRAEAQKASRARELAACRNDPYDSVLTQRRNHLKNQIAIDQQQIDALRRELGRFGASDDEWRPASGAVWINEQGG
jgi:hypothetical protein